MSPYMTMIFLFSLGLGTAVTFSSSHWMLAWMGLEMNTLAIVPLMARHRHPRAVEATTKYFLLQATAAATILFASTINAWMTGEWNIQQTSHIFTTTLITLALALKIGLAPFHMWLPEVLQGLDLVTGLLLSTWQKLAPFVLILQIQPTNSSTLISLGLISTLVGGWGGLNQTQLRKLLAYSSIAHLGWMILVIQYSPSLTLLTLILYIGMTISLFLTLNLNTTTSINAMATSWTKAPLLAAMAPLLLLSLGGLPPLSGFMPKWLILQELTKQNVPFTATMAAMTALLSLYFYLRLSYSMTLTMSPNNLTGSTPWRLHSSQPTLMLSAASTITVLLLPLTPTAIMMLLL
uniref:NADH-ubiquinone oxidoreductase chain 2 n=1 Tax=Callanthias japonicus TaxID=270594 RepID=A0A1V1FJE1_9TELE|nr:NADH dehydrogenase subunit 2 [Callanthias japonicus]BBU25853.1 NADH dehydrogenase subunit 2 [Callanthias japonicus]